MKPGMVTSGNTFIGLSVLAATLFTTTLQAADSYQFEVGLSGGYTDIDEGGKGQNWQLFGSAYLTPVELDGKLPYSEAAFWGRHASVTVAGMQSERSDMNVVRSGRLLVEEESKRALLAVRYAQANLPVWAGVALQYQDETEMRFSDGATAVQKSETIPRLTLGWYVMDTLNVDVSYEWYDDVDSYGLGVNWLYPIAETQAIGIDVNYTRTDTEVLRLNIVNTAIQIRQSVTYNYDDYFVALNYFPIPELKTQIALAIQQSPQTESNKRKVISLGAEYFVTPQIELALNISQYSQDEGIRPYYPDSSNYTAGISYRF